MLAAAFLGGLRRPQLVIVHGADFAGRVEDRGLLAGQGDPDVRLAQGMEGKRGLGTRERRDTAIDLIIMGEDVVVGERLKRAPVPVESTLTAGPSMLL